MREEGVRPGARAVLVAFGAALLPYLLTAGVLVVGLAAGWGLLLGLVFWGVLVGRAVSRGRGRLASVVWLSRMLAITMLLPWVDTLSGWVTAPLAGVPIPTGEALTDPQLAALASGLWRCMVGGVIGLGACWALAVGVAWVTPGVDGEPSHPDAVLQHGLVSHVVIAGILVGAGAVALGAIEDSMVAGAYVTRLAAAVLWMCVLPAVAVVGAFGRRAVVGFTGGDVAAATSADRLALRMEHAIAALVGVICVAVVVVNGTWAGVVTMGVGGVVGWVGERQGWWHPPAHSASEDLPPAATMAAMIDEVAAAAVVSTPVIAVGMLATALVSWQAGDGVPMAPRWVLDPRMLATYLGGLGLLLPVLGRLFHPVVMNRRRLRSVRGAQAP